MLFRSIIDFFFFFNDTATTEIYTLSLHDALPICFAKAGLKVDATDASAEMVALASKRPGVVAWMATFDEIEGHQIYDGIWANFSLLHAPREDVPRHLKALHRALRPGGIFHIGVKAGKGSKRDDLGRLYTYFTDPELTQMLEEAGFTVTDHADGEALGLDKVLAPWIAPPAHA